MSLRGVSALRGASCCPEIHIFISSSGIFNIITADQTVSAFELDFLVFFRFGSTVDTRPCVSAGALQTLCGHFLREDGARILKSVSSCPGVSRHEQAHRLMASMGLFRLDDLSLWTQHSRTAGDTLISPGL